MLAATAITWCSIQSQRGSVTQCGEACFEEREVDAIQSAIKGLDQQARQLVADT